MGPTKESTRRSDRWWLPVLAMSLAIALWAPSAVMGSGASDHAVVASQVGVGTPCQEQTDSVRRLYLAYFGREPERGGFDFWVDRYQTGAGLADMSEFFAVNSQEFLDLYGNLSDQAFVRTLYQSVLGREPDLLGLQFWTNQLQIGVRRGTVMLSFSESEEFVESTNTIVPVAGFLRWFPRGSTWDCGTGSGRVSVDGSAQFADLTVRNSGSSTEMARVLVVGHDGAVLQSLDVEVPGERIRNVANIPAAEAAEIQVQTGSDIRLFGRTEAAQENSSLSYTVMQLETAQPIDRPGWSDAGVAIPEEEPAGPIAQPPTESPTTETPSTESTPVEPPRPEEQDITSEGSVNANTTFAGFPASMAVDGDVGTSWFSSGPGQGDSIFTWSGPAVEIERIEVTGNGSHSNPDFRTNYGFASMTVEVLSGGQVVFSQVVSMAGTPDRPGPVDVGGISGDQVRLILSGHEDPSCGGFSELRVIALV